ncbi:S8/S53 family peptidase [uncultured Dokdonia sp.]|uniref:S8 family peptidase n=1 Tax=uncultured Dokdonia sp. TaxID=575653 RepID=UPI00260D5F78|nr:S8/S53 family peptidase [uncultured Dokdonia sp.]
MKTIYLYIIFGILCSSAIYAQEDRFYIRAIDEDIEIPVVTKDSIVSYTGDHQKLKSLFKKYQVKVFRKGFKYADRDKLKRTYFVIATSPNFQKALLEEVSDIFEFGESLLPETIKIYEPNDYGTTSTTGSNQGIQAYLDYYDFLGVPEAWYYTTGSRDIIVGISDGYVDPENPEFKGKIKVFKKSSYSKGHGIAIAETAVGQGDNGYGSTGICYNCSVYTTTYGDFKFLNQLLELSRAGAKVINCSWGSTRYYETAQEAINEMRDNGTVIVSVPHNASFNKTKGKAPRYPGAYEHVISVGSIQHRFDDITETLHTSEKGNTYAIGLKYYVGRTVGFKKNDINGEQFIFQASTNNLDPQVDILAPGNFIFRYNKYLEDGEILYNKVEKTSPAAPLVTGTIGLMFSINPCLSVDEVNSIIKLTATNIDHIKANAPFKGMYGAGSLHTGRAVKMSYNMLQLELYTVIENQNFSRWNFKLQAPYKLKIKNQKFTDSVSVDFTAKNEILIENETVLLPDENGEILLKIDSNTSYNCKEIKE